MVAKQQPHSTHVLRRQARLQDIPHRTQNQSVPSAPRQCAVLLNYPLSDVSIATQVTRVDKASALIRVDDILGDGLAGFGITLAMRLHMAILASKMENAPTSTR